MAVQVCAHARARAYEDQKPNARQVSHLRGISGARLRHNPTATGLDSWTVEYARSNNGTRYDSNRRRASIQNMLFFWNAQAHRFRSRRNVCQVATKRAL